MANACSSLVNMSRTRSVEALDVCSTMAGIGTSLCAARNALRSVGVPYWTERFGPGGTAAAQMPRWAALASASSARRLSLRGSSVSIPSRSSLTRAHPFFTTSSTTLSPSLNSSPNSSTGPLAGLIV